MKHSISVALATYNGAAFLEQQLDSIYTQTHPPAEVVVCDDRSTDGTVRILEKYRQKYGLSYYVNESTLGVIKNFEKAISLCQSSYIALSDQDDVWLPHKLETGLAALLQLERAHGVDVPLLSFTDLKLVDTQLRPLDQSLWHHLKLNPEHTSLNYLLINNVITGSTVLMNATLKNLALPIPGEAMMHDAWLGLAASYFGMITRISSPTVLYRQHQSNVLGAIQPSATGYLKQLVNRLRQGTLRPLLPELRQAEAFRQAYAPLLDRNPPGKETLLGFLSSKEAGPMRRKYLLLKHRLFSTTPWRTLHIVMRY